MIFAGFASKPVATVSTDLTSKPTVTVFFSLTSKLVAMISPGLTSKSVVGFFFEPQNLKFFLVLTLKPAALVW
jgi:hypothetical protein